MITLYINQNDGIGVSSFVKSVIRNRERCEEYILCVTQDESNNYQNAMQIFTSFAENGTLITNLRVVNTETNLDDSQENLRLVLQDLAEDYSSGEKQIRVTLIDN